MYHAHILCVLLVPGILYVQCVPGILYLSTYLCNVLCIHFMPTLYVVLCTVYVGMLIPCFTLYICLTQWCCRTLYAAYYPCWVSAVICLLQPFGCWIPPTQLILSWSGPWENTVYCVLYSNLSSVCCELIRKSQNIIVNVLEMACVLVWTLLFR